jgi:hypothetical protein
MNMRSSGDPHPKPQALVHSDFLLKPIDSEEFQSSVRRFLERGRNYSTTIRILLKDIMHNIQAPSSVEFRLH